jgi:hypothetical protein
MADLNVRTDAGYPSAAHPLLAERHSLHARSTASCDGDASRSLAHGAEGWLRKALERTRHRCP